MPMQMPSGNIVPPGFGLFFTMIIVAICFLLHCSNGQFDVTTPVYDNNTIAIGIGLGNNGTVVVGRNRTNSSVIQLKIGLMFANKTSR
jgi:hypothetical protein